MQLLSLIICTVVLLNSCTGGIPRPTDHPYSEQKKMQASHHWEVLAKDLANRINNELIITDSMERSVFVQQTCGDESRTCGPQQVSSFNEAFRDLLITNLVDYGIPTRSQVTEDSIEIQYKVQVVHHKTPPINTPRPGVFTALSAAIVVLRNAPEELIMLASGVMADLVTMNLTINAYYEIIITTSMINENKYFFRASDIYYINAQDFYQYQNTERQTRTIQLSTSAPKSRTPSDQSDRQPHQLPQSDNITDIMGKKTDI